VQRGLRCGGRSQLKLIVIGDPHGCSLELEELLAQICPGPEDLVACVGDFTTKGPSPAECLELWRNRGWLSVLGNNDHEVLRAIHGAADEVSAEVAKGARDLERHPDLVTYLESFPLVLDFFEIGCAVVHGGVMPDTSFGASRIDESTLTLREVVRDEGSWRPARSSDPEAARVFWADAWAGDRFVVYGHTPRRVAEWHPRAVGIDTGCVYGGYLTAALRSDAGEWSVASVPARREWARR
jgi:diadenosine tetraphosphatase ApaH/serine/threonine PP2A family protein phosphatase